VFDQANVLEAKDIQISEDLTVEVPPIALEDNKVEERQGKTVSLVKVIWDRRTSDSTWALEEDMRKSHPASFYLVDFHFRGQKFCCWGECKILYFIMPLTKRAAPKFDGPKGWPKGLN